MGILEILEMAGTVILATPMAIIGVDYLLRGDPLGLVFLGLAGLLLGLQYFLTTPMDIPIRVVEKITQFIKK